MFIKYVILNHIYMLCAGGVCVWSIQTLLPDTSSSCLKVVELSILSSLLQEKLQRRSSSFRQLFKAFPIELSVFRWSFSSSDSHDTLSLHLLLQTPVLTREATTDLQDPVISSPLLINGSLFKSTSRVLKEL